VSEPAAVLDRIDLLDPFALRNPNRTLERLDIVTYLTQQAVALEERARRTWLGRVRAELRVHAALIWQLTDELMLGAHLERFRDWKPGAS